MGADNGRPRLANLDTYVAKAVRERQAEVELRLVSCLMHDPQYAEAHGLTAVQEAWFVREEAWSTFRAIRDEHLAEGRREEFHPKDCLFLGGGQFAVAKAAWELEPSGAMWKNYAQFLQEAWNGRELTQLGRGVYGLVAHGPEGIAEAERQFRQHLDRVDQSIVDTARGAVLLEELGSEMEDAVAPPEEVVRRRPVATGLEALDEMLNGGFFPGTYNIMGGRTSMGKTSLAMTVGYNVARRGGGVLILQMEMDRTMVFQDLVSMHSGVPGVEIRSGEYTDGDSADLVLGAVQELKGFPIRIKCGALSLGELDSLVRSACKAHDIKLVIIDYIGLIKSEEEDRRERTTVVSQHSASLLRCARDTGVPHLVLCQLNRDVASAKKEENQRPQLHHLRESGSLEQDADTVILVHRPGYYDRATKAQESKDGVSAAELIVAKHRNGETGEVNAEMVFATKTYREYADIDDQMMAAPTKESTAWMKRPEK